MKENMEETVVLQYHFKDIVKECMEEKDYNRNNGEPHQRFCKCECEVDYDYKVVVREEDYENFKKDTGRDKNKSFEEYIKENYIDEDEEFYDYLKDLYEEDAHNECQEENINGLSRWN